MDESDKPACPHLNGCPMFGLFTMSGSMHVWKERYCRGDFERCERFQRAERGEAVPKRLLPNGKLLGILDR